MSAVVASRARKPVTDADCAIAPPPLVLDRADRRDYAVAPAWRTALTERWREWQ
jgi:hypothetical protein